MDTFAVPPMSAEVEHVFSSLKLLLNERHRRIADDIINAIECLKHWFGHVEHGSFDPHPSVLADYNSDDEEHLYY